MPPSAITGILCRAAARAQRVQRFIEEKATWTIPDEGFL